jgi:hypothetical protein
MSITEYVDATRKMTRGDCRRKLEQVVARLRRDWLSRCPEPGFSVAEWDALKADLLLARQLADLLRRCADRSAAERAALTSQEHTDVSLGIRAPRVAWAASCGRIEGGAR